MHDPRVPETLEGWCVLHQVFGIRWSDVDRLGPEARGALAAEAAAAIRAMNITEEGRTRSITATASMLGHKGDLMLLHLRSSFEEVQAAELQVARLGLARFLELRTSFVSVVELGMYEITSLIHARLAAQGLKPGSPEFEAAYDKEMEDQRRRVAGRLFPELPPRRYVCFYPMNKRRQGSHNWYSLPFEERARLMREHGMIGRRYAGAVTQMISGAIGFDDWEWGVDLFADDPLAFKKLIYEMRFDEASARYAEFGSFYVGLLFAPSELPRLLAGQVPGPAPSRQT